MMKVGIVGAGAVGSACLHSLVMRGVAREIVVVNRNPARAKGLVTDIQYGAVIERPVDLRAGNYADLAGAALVMITAGVNEKTGGATDRKDPAGRLRLLDTNATLYREIVAKVAAAAPEALILVVTDPPDPLADLARIVAGHDRVLSTGTFLDSLRFRFHLAKRLNANPFDVAAQVLGEHGTSQVFLWSSARIAGMPVQCALDADCKDDDEVRRSVEQEVRYANITIIEGTGASQLGIGIASARIAEAILRDERAVMPIGSYQPRYGVTLSLPSVLGRQGVTRVLAAEMSDEESKALERSADTLRNALARIKS
jgi:L-lactate dehydrogenase